MTATVRTNVMEKHGHETSVTDRVRNVEARKSLQSRISDNTEIDNFGEA